MNEEEFLRNWGTLRALILAKWTKLKESDLEDVQPRMDELAQMIHAKYENTPVQSIIEDIENLGHQILKNS